MCSVVAYRFNDSKAFRSSFAEEYAVASDEVFRALYEAESNRGAITGTDVWTVDVDNRACLLHGSDMEHSLVAGLDGGGVGED